jgi:hypothetical protein
MPALSSSNSPLSGNSSQSTAFNLGDLSGAINCNTTDSISASNSNDFYRFSLAKSSSFNIALSNLRADADVELLDASGSLVSRSTNGGAASELISRSLNSGTYFVRVYGYNNADTSYTLNLSGSGLNSDPGSLISNALDFGSFTTSGSRAWNESVSSSDQVDMYRIDLLQSSQLNLGLRGMTADADLYLLNSQGNQLASSRQAGAMDEAISQVLSAGTYYIQVNSFSLTSTNYSISAATTAPPNIAPQSLQFILNSTNLKSTDMLGIYGGFVYDQDGGTDISRVDFQLRRANGTLVADLSDVTSFTPYALNNRWAAFNYSTNLASLGLAGGDYKLWAVAYDRAGAASTAIEKAFTVQQPNIAPTYLQFNLNATTLKSTDTLGINSGWVYDQNGAADIARVDFQLRRANGSLVVDLSDATSFTPNTSNNLYAGFNYSANLANLGLTAGDYKLWATAYDRAGAASSAIEKAFSIQQPNIAPTLLQFNLNATTLKSTDTLSINYGWVYDPNGAADITKVDFQLRRTNGSLAVDLSDATSFTPNTSSNFYAGFNYSINLGSLGLAAGDYKLWAMAYDRAGAASNPSEQGFTIQAAADWFTQNLRDSGLINLARSLAADNNLSRNDMISLFRDASDFSVIDATELTDLRTLVSNAARFTMQDYVRVLSSKIVNSDAANTYSGIGNLFANSTSNQMERLISKWFLGTDRPTAAQGHSMSYINVSSGSLFGNDNVASYKDIRQGFLGDCYFLSSLGANAASRPSAIQNMFVNNQDGTFTVRFYGQTNGTLNSQADYVTVDRYLPTAISGYSEGTFYTGQRYAYYDSADVGLWVALAEKAYAQFAESGNAQRDRPSNSYGSIEGGWGYRAMPSISGVNGGYYADTSWSNLGARQGSFLSLSNVSTMLSQGRAMTADTAAAPRQGLVKNHEYMIISTNLTNGTITLYNPWATMPEATKGILTLSYDDFRQNFNTINAA